MNDTEYRAIERLSSSGMSALAKGHSFYRQWKVNPLPPTQAMQYGIAVHMAILEPDKFDSEYTVCGSSAISQTIALRKAKVVGDNKKICPDYILRIRDKILAHPFIVDVFQSQVKKEEILLWSVNECPCKGKLDIIAGRDIIDIKTTSGGFEQSIVKYHYDRQAAFYLDSSSLFDRFYWVVVNKITLHVDIIMATTEQLVVGRANYLPLCEEYKSMLKYSDCPF